MSGLNIVVTLVTDIACSDIALAASMTLASPFLSKSLSLVRINSKNLANAT